jgi:beta-N-acetylhexosaminidase
MKNKTTTPIDRRDFLKLAGQSTAAIALLAGCLPSSSDSETNVPPIIQSGDSDSTSPEEETTSRISLDVKIGQMLLVGFRGLEVRSHDTPIVEDIRDHHIGGVLLFDYDVAQRRPVRNVQSPEQVRKLVKALQAYSEIPLLVSIDYEGGIITRLPKKYGFPATVSHQYLGRKNNLAFTRQHATQMAQTLAELGINLNFAPVVDVNTNPNNPIIAKKKRSFSADPNIVAKHALEYIKAHHQQNVLCTLKHFPGHGSSRADSHLGMVDVTNTWSDIELIPYRKIIEAGEADAIMTAHVFNRKLDPKYPATLSKRTITDLLRVQLGFEGIVFSDDMQMRAISNHYGLKTAVRKAIEAGVDILVIGNNTGYFVPDIAAQVTGIIKRLVKEGTISSARIDDSYQRILRLKRQVMSLNVNL